MNRTQIQGRTGALIIRLVGELTVVTGRSQCFMSLDGVPDDYSFNGLFPDSLIEAIYKSGGMLAAQFPYQWGQTRLNIKITNIFSNLIISWFFSNQTRT